MIPVQELTFQTQSGRKFLIFIAKHGEECYQFWLRCFDPGVKLSTGYISSISHKSAEEAYKELLYFVTKYLAAQIDGDSILCADNPCNCELLDKTIQTTIVSEFHQFFPVKVNGID